MRTTLASVAALATVLLLAGCSPEPSPSNGDGSSPTPSASASGSASPSPSGSPSESPRLPVPTCEEIVSLDAMYEYNSNVALSPDYAPPAGSLLGRVADMGVACGWVNLSSGEVIAVAVGAPHDDELAEFTAELDSGTAVQWSGVSGHFETVGSDGQASVASGGYLVVSSSPAYFEASDAAPIVEAALSSL